jgi:hypothetical protein
MECEAGRWASWRTRRTASGSAHRGKGQTVLRTVGEARCTLKCVGAADGRSECRGPGGIQPDRPEHAREACGRRLAGRLRRTTSRDEDLGHPFSSRPFFTPGNPLQFPKSSRSGTDCSTLNVPLSSRLPLGRNRPRPRHRDSGSGLGIGTRDRFPRRPIPIPIPIPDPDADADGSRNGASRLRDRRESYPLLPCYPATPVACYSLYL